MSQQISKEYYDAIEKKKEEEDKKNGVVETREVWKYWHAETEEEIKKEESKKEESKKEKVEDEEETEDGELKYEEEEIDDEDFDYMVGETADPIIQKAHGIPYIVKKPPTPRLNPQKLSPKLSQNKSNGHSKSAAQATTNASAKML